MTAVAVATGDDVSPLVGRIRPQTLTRAEQRPHFTSLMNRHMNEGRRIELDWLARAIIRLAYEHDVPVPGHSILYAVIKARLAGRDQVYFAESTHTQSTSTL